MAPSIPEHWSDDLQVSTGFGILSGSIEVIESSVADPGCLSRIPDPGFFPSRIPDPGSRIPDPKKHGEVKNFFIISVFLPFCSFPPLLKQILTHNCCTFYHF